MNNNDINNYDNFSSTAPTSSFNEMGANNQHLKSVVPQPTVMPDQNTLPPVELVNQVPQQVDVSQTAIKQEAPQPVPVTPQHVQEIKNNTMAIEEKKESTEQDQIKSNIWFIIGIFIFIMIFIILLPYINNWLK